MPDISLTILASASTRLLGVLVTPISTSFSLAAIRTACVAFSFSYLLSISVLLLPKFHQHKALLFLVESIVQGQRAKSAAVYFQVHRNAAQAVLHGAQEVVSTEERRVGTEGVGTGR